jgi:hypothetical protein
MPVRPRHCNGKSLPDSNATDREVGKAGPAIPEPGDDPRTGHNNGFLGGGPVAMRAVRLVARTGVLPQRGECP